MRKKVAVGAALAVGVASVVLAGCAESDAVEFPSQDITLVVPYDAGGGTDTIARTLAPHLEEALGQTVLVENRPGGAGAVAMNSILTVDADGHTMIMAAASPTIATPLFNDVGYVPEDFSMVGRAVAAPNVLIVTDASRFQTADEFFEAAVAGESLTVGVSGATSMQTIVVDLINTELGTSITSVPFDGAAGSIVAVRAGDVDATMATTIDVGSVVRAGDARIIAATEPDAVPAILGENIPSFEAQGIVPPTGSDWYGIGGPPGLGAEVLETWAAALEQALQEDDVIDTLEGIGALPGYIGPSEFVDAITDAWETYLPLVD